jgi:hypothetical protein
MCRDKFNVGTKHFLNFIHHAPLDTRNVGDQRTAFEHMLIFLYPFYKRSGVQCEYHKVCLTDETFVNLGCAVFHHAFFNGVVDVALIFRYTFYSVAVFGESCGIAAERICLDPGIGFGKTTEHNLALIRHLAELRVRDLPLMMALSRKRFISELLGRNAPPKTDSTPTVALSLLAAERGADLHRVHDVAPLHHALTLRHAIKQ